MERRERTPGEYFMFGVMAFGLLTAVAGMTIGSVSVAVGGVGLAGVALAYFYLQTRRET